MNIPAVRSGLEFLESLGDTSLRAEAIGSWLYDEFGGMHEGGSSVVLYNTRGNDIVTFGVKRNGQMIDSWEFEQAATEQGIHVRTGCFCNPGVNEELFDYDVDGIQKAYSSDEISENAGIRDLRELLSDQPVGAVRASFGYANVFEDALRLVEFTKQFLGISE